MSKVLLVEDNITLREMYAETLQRAGFEIEVASDGEEGLAKISSFKPDLVLLDLMMPKKTGFEVLEDMRKNDLLKKIPVIIMTDLFADVKDFLSHGVTDYFLKPNYTPDQVVAKIKSLLHTEDVPSEQVPNIAPDEPII